MIWWGNDSRGNGVSAIMAVHHTLRQGKRQEASGKIRNTLVETRCLTQKILFADSGIVIDGTGRSEGQLFG